MALPGIEIPKMPPDCIYETARALKDAAISLFITFSLYGIYAVASKMYSSDCLEDFVKEYGLLLLDILTRFPLVRTLRTFLRDISNRNVAKANRPSLLQLPGELILDIAYFAATTPCPSHGYNGSCFGQQTSHKELAKLTVTNKRIRALLSPILLRDLQVGKSWWRAARALNAMERSTDAHMYAKAFKIEVYNDDGKGPRPPKLLATGLATTLQAFQQLSMLILVIPEHHTEPFRKAFEDRAVTLASVRTLVLGAHMEWVISICSNVEMISTSGMQWLHSNVDGDFKHRHSFDLIRAAGLARKLRHFEMHDWWQRRHVWAIRRSMPKIESLAMPGGRYMGGVAELMPILGHFEQLRTLALANAADLDVGFEPPGCGNVYFGPGGEEYRNRVAEAGRQAENRVAEMAFAKIPGLAELWVGDCAKAAVKRSRRTGETEMIEWTYGNRQRLGDRRLFHKW